MKLRILASALAVAASSAASAACDEAAMRRLMVDRSCSLCHTEISPPRLGNPVPPYAPSWQEVAKRYRGRPSAEDHLIDVILNGSDPSHRHWSGDAFTTMLPNAPAMTLEEARSLAHWILSFPSPVADGGSAPVVGSCQ